MAVPITEKKFCFSFFRVNYLFSLGFKKCKRYQLQTKQRLNIWRGVFYLKGDIGTNRWGLNSMAPKKSVFYHIYIYRLYPHIHLYISIHQSRPPKQSTRLRLQLWQHHHRRKKYYNPRKKLHLNPQASTLAKERQHNIRRNNGKLRRRRNMWTRGKLSTLPTPRP